MDPFTEPADRRLESYFNSLREDTLTRLAPPGAVAARARAQRRRHRLVLAVMAGIVVLVSGTLVGGYVLTAGPAWHPVVAGTPGSPRPSPAGSTDPASAAPSPSTSDGVQPSTPPPSSGADRTPRCHTSDLSAGFFGGQGHAGSWSMGLRLTNISTHTCHFYGFPGLLLIDDTGRPLATTVSWIGPKATVTVAPGDSGYADLTGYNAQAVGEVGAPCDPPATALLITPPDETTQLRVDGPIRACGHGMLDVSAMRDTPPEPVS